MEQNNNWYKSEEERKLAEQIIDMEKAALDKWFKGDSSAYRALWSEDDFSYFDSVADHRVDMHEEISAFVKSAVDGKLFADSYDFCNPRVQFGGDMAVLTYQLHADTTLSICTTIALKSIAKKLPVGVLFTPHGRLSVQWIWISVR